MHLGGSDMHPGGSGMHPGGSGMHTGGSGMHSGGSDMQSGGSGILVGVPSPPPFLKHPLAARGCSGPFGAPRGPSGMPFGHAGRACPPSVIDTQTHTKLNKYRINGIVA